MQVALGPESRVVVVVPGKYDIGCNEKMRRGVELDAGKQGGRPGRWVKGKYEICLPWAGFEQPVDPAKQRDFLRQAAPDEGRCKLPAGVFFTVLV